MSTPCYLTVQSGPVIFFFNQRYCIIQPTSPASNALLPLPLTNLPISFLVYCLREHSTHVTPDSGVIEQTLDRTNGRDGDILVPNLSACKVHHILSCHCVDSSLNFSGAHTSASGDDLAANVLGKGGGTVKREQDGSLELGLGTLGLGLTDGLGQARPLTQGEVDKVVDLC